MLEAFIVSTVAGWATGLGAVPLLFFRTIPHRIYDGLLGMSAGIMVTAAGMSLIEPALKAGSLSQVVGGLLLGTLFMMSLERFLPHMEPHFSGKAVNPTLHMGALVAIATTIHNFPEGFSTGIGYYSLPRGQGIALALAIAIQNVPEGLAVALPLWRGGMGRAKIFFFTFATAMAEPVAGLLGIVLVTYIHSLLPYALGFAGGGMLYVSLLHPIPESYSHKHEKEATLGVISGLLLMLLLEFLFST